MKLRDGGRGPIFSFRRAVVCEVLPRLGETKANEVALVGVRLELEARVTGDRRFVNMKLTQHSTELRRLRYMKTSIKGEDVALDVPDVQQSSTSNSNSISVGDGVVVVVPPAVPLPGFTPKRPVPLLFVQTSIWIGEEEALKNKQRMKK